MCTFSIDIGMNKEKEICLPKKESVSVYRCERTSIASKCEMFMNFSQNIMGICQKTNMINKQYLRDHRYERKPWLTNVEYLRLSTSNCMGIIHMCIVSTVFGINADNKMPAKQEIHK